MKNLLLAILILFGFNANAQQTVEDDFEGNGTISTWFGDDANINAQFNNPYKETINTSNTVLQYEDVGGQYANIRFELDEKFDLSEDYTFSFKIYVPAVTITGSQDNQVSLKLQNGDLNEPWSTQTEIVKDVTLNQWQTVTFNFKDDNYINLNAGSAAPITRTDFNRVVIQVNGENNTDRVTAYIDDFLYDGTIAGSSDDEPVFDNLVWSDEFDGQTGFVTDLDNSKWFKQIYPIIGGNSWANGEIQHYTDRLDNSYVSNGTLKILAKKETYSYNGTSKNYTSARLNSKYAFTYGKVEIRAKMPTGVGTFPALWMLGQNITETGGYWAATKGTTPWPDCGEIDIIEHWGDNQDFVQSALHNRSSFGSTVNKGGRTISNASSEFHVYTLEWTATKMTFSVDGIVHYVYNPENKNAENWPYDAPQYLLLNVAILPNITAGFSESAMEVDYVRVYQESASLSTEDNTIKNQALNVYPNPSNSRVTVNLGNVEGESELVLYSITGKKVHSFSQDIPSETHDISFLKRGVYFLQVASSKNSKVVKLIKN
ncbi:family 16 glycosylhydrolase [Polaribacter sp. MED152]|uniref:family 16 glycosylhydrolase n=1 Tax=Polaribacter sp. MED152 TaxID=313598 RepID=UPI0000689A30|nr:family 16 glycosylhydrolase [Polaribacter sp. MED152]EAQ40669.1 glycosyl hydrolase family 16 [Polaribacter sp. MED152]